MLNVQGDVSQAADGRFKADTNAPFTICLSEYTQQVLTGANSSRVYQVSQPAKCLNVACSWNWEHFCKLASPGMMA